MAKKAADNWNEPGVTIAFLGDSVTQGCFELYRKGEDGFETYFDKNSAYHLYLSKILSVIFPTVPVNIVNAGVSGGSAPHGLERLERDVLAHNPDLTVVCFGLNDCGNRASGVDAYVDALDRIFTKLEQSGSEIIFMTPNTMATEISCHLERDEVFLKLAKHISALQNEGMLDLYLDAARVLCERRGVKVCDCHAKWNKMAESGVNTTELLANKLNHPTREMNWMFAYSLVETMFE